MMDTKNKLQYFFKPKNLIRAIVILVVITILIFINSKFPDEENIPKIYYFIFVMVLSGAGILFLFYLTIRYLLTYKWETADALVLESRVRKYDDSEGMLYESYINYRYKVGIKEYISDRIYPFKTKTKSSFESLVSDVVGRYHQGQYIKIFYNPKHPEISFLERKGLKYIIIFQIFISLIFILMFLAVRGVIEL